jgi:putative membrane protein
MSAMASRWMLLAMTAGLAMTAWLIVDQGAAAVGRAVVSIGWGLPLILLVHLGQLALSGAAWSALIRRFTTVKMPTFMNLRLVREAVDNALPVIYIAGEVAVIRLLGIYHVRPGLATASIVVDWTMELASQFLFTLMGLVLLLAAGYQGPILRWVVLVLVATMLTTVGFLLFQRSGMFRLLERLTARLGASFSRLPPDLLSGLNDSIHAIYADRRRVWASCLWHTLSWMGGALEVWVILYCMGTPVTLDQALVMESLGTAVRSVGFVIPGGFGIQEGGFLLIGMIYGIPTGNGLALSLLKRVRELLLIPPGLWLWHRLEKHYQSVHSK